MKDQNYFVRIFWSDEDDCYVAEVPELKGCSGLGHTPEKAFKEAQRSIAGWLEVAKKNRIPIPKPIAKDKVDRLNLRLPSDVIRKIKMAAREHGLSINQYVMKQFLKFNS